MPVPLLTLYEVDQLNAAVRTHACTVECSLDLGRSVASIEVATDGWVHGGQIYPYLSSARPRTIYHWSGTAFEPISRYSNSLIKLVPTDWGAPTFEIDGIKMLPTLHLSPFDDAANKVELIQPGGKRILDCCGGLGYFAHWCLQGGATRIVSFEKNPYVIWLRSLNPWSPEGSGVADARLQLHNADVAEQIVSLPDESVDAVLHDPPRFGIAGELYSQVFYGHLARVLKRNGRLFHYTGSPNKLTSGRDVPNEVSQRLRAAGFTTEVKGDGVLAVKRTSK